MATPSKIVNIDALGYTLATKAAGGIAQDEITLAASGAAVKLTAGLTGRRKLFIRVPSGQKDVHIGPSGVTTSNGYLMKANGELWLDVGPGADVYGRAGATASKVRVLEISTGGTTAPALGGGAPARIVNIDAGGFAQTTQAGGTVKEAKVTVTSTTTLTELTANLPNRRKLYIKLLGDDVNGQSFVYVGGSDIELGGDPPNTSTGMPVCPRYELVLDVGPNDTINAIRGGEEDLDVRLLEID